MTNNIDISLMEISEYLEYYPYSDEEGYDGVHDGGLKGIKDNAPDWAKKIFYEATKKEYKDGFIIETQEA